MSQLTLTSPNGKNYYSGALNTGRMYVRPNVYLPNSEIDFQTGMIKNTMRRTGRTQALQRELTQLNSEFENLHTQMKARMNENGLRMSLKAAVAFIAAALIIFSVILLVQQGNIIARQETIRLLNDTIKSTQSVVIDISAQIDEACDPVQICYTAARELDMVPSDSAQAIFLTALSTRPGQEPIAIRAGND